MIPESYWKLASADLARSKADWAHFQTAELGRKRTIISVTEDEAFAIYMALGEYVDRHRKDYQ